MLEKLEYHKYKELRDSYEKKVSRLANIRMLMFIMMLISFILKYYYYKVLFNIVFVISLSIFFVMVLVHDKYFKVYDYYVKYLEVLDSYIARENGNWKEFKDKGIDFLDESKSYLSDLDILGECSLFQYLSVCKTLGGREKLVSKLSNLESTEKELLQNQKLIEELVKDVDFGIKFQVMMNFYEGKEIHLTKKLRSFQGSIGTRLIDFFIGIIASGICIILFILGCLKIIPLAYFYGMFFFNLGISFLYSYIYREEFSSLDRMVKYYAKLVPVFELVGNYMGTSSKMKRICKNIRDGIDNIAELKSLEGIDSLRNNLLSNFLFNGFGCLNLMIMYKYSLFLEKSFNNLEDNIEDIEELEAMISLATIGIVKNDKCMPIIVSELGLKFSGLKHPLIDEKLCVSNDFEGKDGVNIITGSNMGGKTTFLRTIGINLILMQAGTYVCADNLEASYFKIFTSMRVMDNIEKGISTFYGELLRIKECLEYVDKGNMLVLIDEIFKGTNYNDRMYGAKEVVRKLNNKDTIAFITTHDFELCESNRVKNYHVKEDYEGDKIIFDYKIRNGKCSSTNAKFLMKILGIID